MAYSLNSIRSKNILRPFIYGHNVSITFYAYYIIIVWVRITEIIKHTFAYGQDHFTTIYARGMDELELTVSPARMLTGPYKFEMYNALHNQNTIFLKLFDCSIVNKSDSLNLAWLFLKKKSRYRHSHGRLWHCHRAKTSTFNCRGRHAKTWTFSSVSCHY